jgi:hypothetical protein
MATPEQIVDSLFGEESTQQDCDQRFIVRRVSPSPRQIWSVDTRVAKLHYQEASAYEEGNEAALALISLALDEIVDEKYVSTN